MKAYSTADVLVVIDVQRGFDKPKGFTKRLADYIQQSKNQGVNIIYLEMLPRYYGETIRSVLSAGKPIAKVLRKAGRDGSQQLLKSTSLRNKVVELVGLFREQCVLETWKGLRRAGVAVQPVKISLTAAGDELEYVDFPDGYLLQ